MSEMASSRPKRKRTKTVFLENDVIENDEKRLIQKAIELSKKQTCRRHFNIEEGAIFYPTEDEFRDPLKYINSIREEGEKCGICKIVPPSGWRPPRQEHTSVKMPTKLQNIHELQEGKGFDDGKKYSLSQYKVMAENYQEQWIRDHHAGVHPGMKILEQDYWDIVETCRTPTSVEYANDLDILTFGSGFPRSWHDTVPVTGVTDERLVGIEPSRSNSSSTGSDTDSQSGVSCGVSGGVSGGVRGGSIFDDPSYYSRTGWNLNLLPHMHASLLKHLKANISGVNVPWLYVGMQFTSFCWHNEDNYLYSINYSHEGAVKQWYGVPATSASAVEKAVAAANTIGFQESPDLLHHMALQVSPSYLRSQGVPVRQLGQEPGTFIITFPQAFHGGFSYGFNIGEAVNFAIPDWLKYGGEAAKRYSEIGRPSALSYDRLLCTVLHHLKDQSSLPLWAYPILAQEIDRLIDNEIFFRQEVYRQGVKKTISVLPKNDFECLCESSTDYDELRSCLWCHQYCIFSVVICNCDKQAVMCPAHSHKRCRNNRKCPVDQKTMLVWASTDELKALKSSMHALMTEHKRQLKREVQGLKSTSGGIASSSAEAANVVQSFAAAISAINAAPATSETGNTTANTCTRPSAKEEPAERVVYTVED